MDTNEPVPLTPEELAGEGATALPDKEVVSILDLAADIDLAIDGAAPVDLAIALNANVVAPIDAAVSANLLSDGSSAQALADDLAARWPYKAESWQRANAQLVSALNAQSVSTALIRGVVMIVVVLEVRVPVCAGVGSLRSDGGAAARRVDWR